MNKFTSIGIERLRINRDGQGITTLVAGYGCPCRCHWCLNPQCFNENKKTKTYTVEELIDEVSIDDLYFQSTDGGITFGGGEPLLYADFIHELKEKCNPNWKINLESSLNIDTNQLLKVIDDIDYFMIDIKDMNPIIYESYTLKSNELVLQNLKLLQSKKDKVCIRIPNIPEFNTEQDIQYSIQKIKELGFKNIDTFTYNVNRSLSKQRR